MPDVPATEVKPEETTPPAGTDTPTTETPSTDEPPATEPEQPTMTLEDALAEVKQTRGEAANYRVKLREAEEKLANAKSLDEVNEIVASMQAERTSAERALLVENVALKFNLPDALAARLQGATREEMEADAKALASLIPAADTAPVRLQGGLTPDDEDTEPSDPGELARKYGRGRRAR